MRRAIACCLILSCLSGCGAFAGLTLAEKLALGASGIAAGTGAVVLGQDLRNDASCADQDIRAVRSGTDPLLKPCGVSAPGKPVQ